MISERNGHQNGRKRVTTDRHWARRNGATGRFSQYQSIQRSALRIRDRPAAGLELGRTKRRLQHSRRELQRAAWTSAARGHRPSMGSSRFILRQRTS